MPANISAPNSIQQIPQVPNMPNADGIIFLLDPFNQNDFKQKLIQSTPLGESAIPDK